jgi:hypothetical protein
LAATVQVDSSTNVVGRYGAIFFVGEIQPSDVGAVKSALMETQRAGLRQVRFFLNSSGGDLDAAMAIGREIRNAKASVWILPIFSCASACVLILAAGIDKFVKGPVVIHRPYMATVPNGMTYEKMRFLHAKTEAAVKKYLLEMNVLPTLYDEMFAIEPQDARRLSAVELTKYRLDQTDAAYEELRDAEMASSLGISKTEYLRRKGRVDSACSRFTGRPEQVKQCVDEVLEGKR